MPSSGLSLPAWNLGRNVPRLVTCSRRALEGGMCASHFPLPSRAEGCHRADAICQELLMRETLTCHFPSPANQKCFKNSDFCTCLAGGGGVGGARNVSQPSSWCCPLGGSAGRHMRISAPVQFGGILSTEEPVASSRADQRGCLPDAFKILDFS